MFMRFDSVRYTGGKLTGEIGNKIGEVIMRIPTGGYVVEFGNDAYVVADNNLVRHSFSESSEKKGPEITRRRKYESDEE